MFQIKSIIPIIFIVFLFVHSAVYPLNFKDIQRIDIRACENSGALLLSRYLAAIAQDIHIWKCDMHRHRAELSTLRIKIIRITDLMSSVTALFALLVDQCNPDLRSCHQSSTSIQVSSGIPLYLSTLSAFLPK